MRILLCLFALSSLAAAQVHAQTKRDSAGAESARSCTTENGLTVCRNVVVQPVVEVRAEPTPQRPQESRGQLYLLLDIPSNIFSRLAAPPESNRKYHPKQSWAYRPVPPAPPGSGKYRPLPAGGERAWQYKPKATFAYQPTSNWTFDRDVFGRLWRSNIKNDTRIVEIPIEEPAVILLPVDKVR